MDVIGGLIMKIWVLCEIIGGNHAYSHKRVIGVYSSKKEAERAKKDYNESFSFSSGDFDIEPFILDRSF